MTISAKIVADSISVEGVRLTTMQLRYPRFIHAEELTHRVLSSQPDIIELICDGVMYDRNLSRNASSSRAIPVKKLIEDIERDPVYPSFWGSNKPGMQAGEECNKLVYPHEDSDESYTREEAWDLARSNAIAIAKGFSNSGYHKQIVNRLLEPFSHINVVVTATEWSNFYALRRHPDAQPEIKELADVMWSAQMQNEPKLLKSGDWHLPYLFEDDWHHITQYAKKFHTQGQALEAITDYVIRISVSRCARVSYLTHDGKKPDVESDLKLYDRLLSSIPLHASPAEHQGTPDSYSFKSGPFCKDWENPELHGNFTGWVQYRKTLDNESQ